jgi:hypothetical protein
MKTKFISKYGQPITGQPRFKRPATIGGGTTADDGSTQQAEQQITSGSRLMMRLPATFIPSPLGVTSQP